MQNARELRKNQTDAESLLWQLLRNRQIADCKFRRQHPIEPYILDFYCHEKKLAIELDGGQHNTESAIAQDHKRTEFLASQDIAVLRFWNNDVLQNTEAVLQRIYDTLNPHPDPLPQGEGAIHPSPAGRRWPEGSDEGNDQRAYQDIPGFCKSVTLAEIKKHDYVLTPGRYVGAAEQEADGEPFEDKIELNRRMNEALESITRAIFKSWFVDFDSVRAKASGEPPESICRRLRLTPDLLALFPVRLVDSELGEIPEGWEVGTIGHHCYLNAESWTTKTMPKEVHYVDLANAKDGIISEVQVFSSSTAPSRARRVLRAGDTIVGTVRPEDEESIAWREAAKTKWAALEKLVGAEPRIKQVAADIVQHFEARNAAMEGKSMIVTMSREICAQLYNAIVALRPDWHSTDPAQG